MVKCINCKFIKNIKGKTGSCFGHKIDDVNKEMDCKYFKKG